MRKRFVAPVFVALVLLTGATFATPQAASEKKGSPANQGVTFDREETEPPMFSEHVVLKAASGAPKVGAAAAVKTASKRLLDQKAETPPRVSYWLATDMRNKNFKDNDVLVLRGQPTWVITFDTVGLRRGGIDSATGLKEPVRIVPGEVQIVVDAETGEWVTHEERALPSSALPVRTAEVSAP